MTTHHDLGITRVFDPDLDWTTDGLCREIDTDMFFPEKGGDVRTGKAVCRVCPVSLECLAYALRHDERFGIWGGLSEQERRRLRKHLDPRHQGDQAS
jgi:WhiB family redox-sensing transcriptional regulator